MVGDVKTFAVSISTTLMFGMRHALEVDHITASVLSSYQQPQPFQPPQPNPWWKPNPLWNGKAIAWWVVTNGPDVNSTTAATIAITLRVIVAFEFIVSISTLFDYKYNLIYSADVLQI